MYRQRADRTVNRLQFITLAVALSLIITISAILVARTVVMRTRYRRHVAINAMTAAASGRGTRLVLPLLPAAVDISSHLRVINRPSLKETASVVGCLGAVNRRFREVRRSIGLVSHPGPFFPAHILLTC